MRVKDENKKDAILSATIKMINEIGFANVSMSKIAKAAGVSASTIYIYYENKEDMFKKIYIDVKTQMLNASMKGIRDTEPVEQSVLKFCENVLNFARNYEDYFLFIGQAGDSPLVLTVKNQELLKLIQQACSPFERGIKEGILKNVSPALLSGFCFYPITQLYKDSCHQKDVFGEIDYKVVFEMCWDAIKK
ncbi:transcriptional regulator, TetR family [Alkaliphilus metalliredigens QYMF]|uniref:Transcriptional regulator, TetR family n=1 Tax=Alkaliphilus metalliredigens (strain QYMF) TaxID=293826 RepID=A6TP33_ALKMQ|nr:TetR/AcrR family transcriptional regulator [Alkaliphilus metalliredigens]ABR47951.1 transcriptional regulator, TetR family [Alkaliphilus metalliredigens QYMF]